MKILKVVSAILIVLGLSSVANANGMKKPFQAVKPSQATLLQTNSAKKFCPVCGMTLPMFYKTNHAAQTKKGVTRQYCSLHCLVEDNKNHHHNLKHMQVVDVKSLKFINVADAYYVVGSKKHGTMTMVSKYAFAKKSDAKEFKKKFGGKIMRFKGAYEEAKKDFAKDSKMIHKKQSKMAKMGHKIYNKQCEKTDMKFASVAKAKAYILRNKLCKDINGKQLQAVGLYLHKR